MPVEQNTRKWTPFVLTLAVVLVAAAGILWAFPLKRGLVWLGLYTIPSHMFVSPFAHEPVLLYYAKSFRAWECAVASTIGCLIAGIWDYWLFVPLIHHPSVRTRYVNTGLYRHSVRLFRRSPFLALVVVGLTPIPFYPVKFLSIADGYPVKRYLAALVVGRAPRYYALAYLGYVLKLPNWSLVALALILLVITIYKSRSESASDAEKDRGAEKVR